MEVKGTNKLSELRVVGSDARGIGKHHPVHGSCAASWVECWSLRTGLVDQLWPQDLRPSKQEAHWICAFLKVSGLQVVSQVDSDAMICRERKPMLSLDFSLGWGWSNGLNYQGSEM